jgi:hypothetical protein
MRWDLVARWTIYSGGEAAVRFEEMVQEGMKGLGPEDLTGGSWTGAGS